MSGFALEPVSERRLIIEQRYASMDMQGNSVERRLRSQPEEDRAGCPVVSENTSNSLKTMAP